jgi:parallel beta-helix repeat protein
MRVWQFLCGAIVCVAFQSNESRAEIVLHVSVGGDDVATGAVDAPLGSLIGARNRIRELRSDAEWTPQPILVLVHGGTYQLSETIALQAEDSGTPEAPIVYSAAPSERVVLSGAARLTKIGAATQFQDYRELTSDAQDHVVVYQFDESLTEDHFSLPVRHHDIPMQPSSVELFDRSGKLPRAGWPDNGWAEVKGIGPDANSWNAPECFRNAATDTAWAHGFFEHDYQDLYLPVQLLHNETGDTDTVRIGSDGQTTREGARYRIENVLTCLDSQGEWFVDSVNNRLLVWPTESIENDGPCVSKLSTLISLYDVENVSFVGLGLQAATVSGIEIAGGTACTIDRCEIGCVGNVGVHVFHGYQHTVSNCELFAIAASGLRIEGGNRETLEPAEHVCKNNFVRDCGYNFRARRAGIEIHGVGIVVEKNEVASLPDWGIQICGNDHLVQFNHVHHVCQETSDSGAIYLAHDPTYRGNTIRNNHIHDIGGYDTRDVVGIYLDDFASETTVEGNVIESTPRGVVIGGGRDNIVRNNVIRDCLAGIQLDSRGETWASHRVGDADGCVEQCLVAIHHDQTPYAERYPRLVSLLDDAPGVAKGNTIESNVIQCPIGIDLQNISRDLVSLNYNTQRGDQVFRDALAYDFSTSESELAGRLKINAIPFEEIGRIPGSSRVDGLQLQASR